MVDLVSRHHFWGDNCLRRSLATWWFLRRQGVDTQLRIGVRKHGPGIEAHAWLEHDGVVLTDQPDIGTAFPAFSEDIVRKLIG